MDPSNAPSGSGDSEVERLRQQIHQLQAIAHEYNHIKEILKEAAQDHSLEKYAGEIVLYLDPTTLTIRNANLQALDFLGYSLEWLQGRLIDDIEVCDEIDTRTYIETSIETHIYQCHYRHQAGFQVPVRVRRRLVEKDGKTVLHYALEDLSLHKQVWRELIRREDVNHQFRAKLTLLNEINIELSRAGSFDEVCRRGVELGIQRLGFDRMSLWFLDSQRQHMMGTYGVDEDGNLRDERGQSWSFEDTYVTDFMNGKKEPVVTEDAAPLYNDKSEFVGSGWHVSTPILDGERFIGFMGADNFIHRQPLKSYQVELFRLYGATIGHLAARQLEHETIHKLSRAIQSSASMIIIFTDRAIIEFVNNSFARISGYKPEEVLGRHLELLLFKTNFQEIWQTISTGDTWKGELSQYTKDGQCYETLVSVSPINSGDRIKTYVMVQEDISALKQARQKELELRLEQERVHVLETFITDIGHEFKTPLSVISNAAYIISKSSDPAKRDTKTVTIQEQVTYLSQMITDMFHIIELGGGVALEIKTVDLKLLITSIVHRLTPLATKKQLQWELVLDPPLTIQADSDLLGRAIEEIITNAIQYSPENALISIQLHDDETQIGIRIRDRGIGIAESDLGKIFNHFYRADKARSTRGTGLGLAIAKLVLDRHHGEIKVQSNLKQGSTFDLLLPRNS